MKFNSQEQNKWNFKHRKELESILAKFDINKNDICLVGSIALSAKNMRVNKDIDFCTKSNINSTLSIHLTGNRLDHLSENVNLVIKKYEIIGISDEELIENSSYHDIIDGFKVIKLEIVFSLKNCRLKEKDITDIQLIEKYLLSDSLWDWSLVRDCVKTLNSVGIEKKLEKNQNNHFDLQNINFLLSIMNFVRRGKHKIKKVIKLALTGSLSPRSLHSWYYNRIIILRRLKSDVIIKYPTAKLIGKNYIYSHFNRIDIIVRYLAIEEFFKKNDIGFSLYLKMQEKRLGRHDETVEVRFRKLIESFLEHGFDAANPILVDTDFALINGSHRLALASYLNISEVPIQFFNAFNSPSIKPYDFEWFQKNEFSNEELTTIEAKKNDLFEKLGLFFYVILWPAVQDFFDEIDKDLRLKYHVVSCQNLFFGDDDFQDFTRSIYAIDDIPSWKVERKLHAMKPYPKQLRVLALEIPDPKFRKKRINNHDLSDVGAKLKLYYRKLYASRISNYIYDIIIHTGDNYESNSKINQILNDFQDKNINLI